VQPVRIEGVPFDAASYGGDNYMGLPEKAGIPLGRVRGSAPVCEFN